MARTVLVAGTESHAGKSTVAAGLCRLLADAGADVAPFKAQNMSNNARAVPKVAAVTDSRRESARGGADTGAGADRTAFGEVGVSQYVQARAARVRPTTDHNPVLLKPRGDAESQLVLDGEAVGHYRSGEYYDDYWERARETARRAHERLAAEHDVVVAEGAGSIAEPNLRHRDLANLETARFADADVLLVADIERGGAFASLVGTSTLLPADVREQVVGAVLTKFRGDESLLDAAIDEVEERTGVPVLGVLPHDDPGLPAEDSVDLPAVGERTVRGGDEVPAERAVAVAVPRLPHISNFTDLEPLAREPGVRVAYVPLDASLADVSAATGTGTAGETGIDRETGADAVVLPGTKNTVDDLLALRDAGFDAELRAFDGPVVGLCGGYQLLGERITNAGVESTDDPGTVAGLGLLPVETRFSPDKRVAQVTRRLRGVGPLAGAAGEVSGYEIHMGETALVANRAGTGGAPERLPDADTCVARPFPDADTGAATDSVLGTYLHGIFENRTARDAFVETVFADAGLSRPTPAERNGSPYDRAAGLVAELGAALVDPLGLTILADVVPE